MEKIYLPVRKRLMYDTDNPMDDQTSYMVIDDKGYIVSKKLSKPIADELVSIMNYKYSHTIKDVGTKSYGQRLLHLRMMLEPMEKPREQIPLKNRAGEIITVDHPEYIKYLKVFKGYACDGVIEQHCETPISQKVQVVCGIHCSSTANKTLALMQLSIIEGLCYAGIIKTVRNEIVTNMDGSFISKAKGDPRMEIYINSWG